MKKRILSMILICCMLIVSAQGVFAGEADPADMEEVVAESATEAAAVSDEIADPEIAVEDEAENEPEPEEAEEADIEEDLLEASAPSVTYRTHVQKYGWQGWKKDGEMSGTQAESKRLEGIEIEVQGDANLGIRYKTHIQTYGWESAWKTGGQTSGTVGQSKRLEAIQIELTGTDASKYDVWYCVHAQKFGWLNWAKNGSDAGTAGYSYRLEGIKIRILPKGSSAPANEGKAQAAFYSKNDGPAMNTNTSGVAYNTHVQTYGWQDFVYNGGMAGTQGQSKRLEGIHIALVDPQYSGGIEYRTHIQTYGWESTWRSNGQMSGTSGQAKRLEAIQIRLTGEMANKYDVYYRVHAQKFGWMGWAKNGELAGTAGYSYRLEAIQIVLVNKGGSRPSTSLGGHNQNVSEGFKQKDNTASDLFNKIAGNYSIPRYAGYWSANLNVGKDGSVTGNGFDSGMASYSRYYSFSGKFTNVKKVDAYTYTATLTNYKAYNVGKTERVNSQTREYYDPGFNNVSVKIFLTGHASGSLPDAVKSRIYGTMPAAVSQPWILLGSDIYGDAYSRY